MPGLPDAQQLISFMGSAASGACARSSKRSPVHRVVAEARGGLVPGYGFPLARLAEHVESRWISVAASARSVSRFGPRRLRFSTPSMGRKEVAVNPWRSTWCVTHSSMKVDKHIPVVRRCGA